MRKWAGLVVLALCGAAPVAAYGDSVFNFENVAAGTALPFALSVNGITATFSGNGAVCAATGLSGAMFVGLTGNALMQGFCTTSAKPTYGPVVMAFSNTIAKVNFALAINGTDPAPVTITYLLRGNAVGTQTVNPAVPAGPTISPEIAVSYSGAFDSISVSSTALVAIDNVDALASPFTPE